MVPSLRRLRRLLVGPADARLDRRLDLLAAVALAVLTAGAYAVGVFGVDGCVVLLPADASLVGLVAALGLGYRGGGLLFAWLVAYAPLVGFDVESALLGLSSRPLAGRVAALLDPEGLAVYAVAAAIIGTLGFGAGYLARFAVGFLRREGAGLRF